MTLALSTQQENSEMNESTWNHVVLGDGTRAVLVPGPACINVITEADGHRSCNHTDAYECDRTGHETISLWEVIREGDSRYFAPVLSTPEPEWIGCIVNKVDTHP